jgi:hypothetical protein
LTEAEFLVKRRQVISDDMVSLPCHWVTRISACSRSSGELALTGLADPHGCNFYRSGLQNLHGKKVEVE